MTRDVYAGDERWNEAVVEAPRTASAVTILVRGDADPSFWCRVAQQAMLANALPARATLAVVGPDEVEVSMTFPSLAPELADRIVRKLAQLTCVCDVRLAREPRSR